MKKIIRYFVFCLLILSISSLGLILGDGFLKTSRVTATEQLVQEYSNESDVSIFIRKPTYSVFYNKKLC